ncbi:unnamed protein product [Rhizophagus irregularis]|nr:unnamed protein product [Rhizophagus irregularis]
MNQDKEVVLKCPNNLNENLDEFLNEWKYHQSFSNSHEIINLYGFTKSSDALNYMVVIDYANKGNLRGNLVKVTKYNWKQKLNMLYKIISGLYKIHKQDLIHCDLHDGNILNHSNKKDEAEEENEVDNNLVFPFSNEINEELENNKMEFINAQIGKQLNKILESEDSQSCSTTGNTEDLDDYIIKDMNN